MLIDFIIGTPKKSYVGVFLSLFLLLVVLLIIL